MNSRYTSIPQPRDEITATNMICRLLQSIGFRFYWATEGLQEKNLLYRPCAGARSIGETIEHVWKLLNWIFRSIDPAGRGMPGELKALRAAILELVSVLEDSFSKMTNEDLALLRIRHRPIWYMINGPLSDLLSHIGQIATLRRLAGNPVAASNPFEGKGPD